MTLPDIAKCTRLGLLSFPKRPRRGRPVTKGDTFAKVHEEVQEIGISEACRRNNVSRQGYYKFVKRKYGNSN
jgi:hypothetical protein